MVGGFGDRWGWWGGGACLFRSFLLLFFFFLKSASIPSYLPRTHHHHPSSINFVLSALLFNIVPTALEISLVTYILAAQFGWQHAGCVVRGIGGGRGIGWSSFTLIYRPPQRPHAHTPQQQQASR